MLAPLSITGRLALIVVLALPATAFADSIDMLLAKEAPKIVKRLAKGGFETVAVMPFRVRNPETGVAIKGAMIQTNFAAKLERALAAAYDREQPVQIVFDAWDQIQQENPGASILTADGRKSIFQHTFDLPVAAPPTKIDAFLTGIIQPSADYRTTTVSFELCAADRPGQL
ncbi:MAG: hypothetical protein HKN47_14495, partial [Pirellulaceae bacterium]|nr:hypothetical protein [Pirellulaceae bacterium]